MKGLPAFAGVITAITAVIFIAPSASAAASPAGFQHDGALNTVENVSNGVHIVGWVRDLNTSSPIYADITVDGRSIGLIRADRPRGDSHDNYGFDLTTSIAEGDHRVCLNAVTIPNAGQTTIECRTSTVANQPFGSLDVVERTGPAIRAGGWAIDPNTNLPIDLHIYVDGVFAGAKSANEARSDIGTIYPAYGPLHGYNAVVAASVGTHNVCVYAINVGPGSNTLLGCRSLTISHEPSGALDGVEHSGSTLRASGWAIDPDSAESIPVHLYIDGVFVTQIQSDSSRPDLVPFYPSFGPNHGYLFIIPDRPGNHTVCVWAINIGPGPGNPQIGCKNV